jgi:hypothetical protein
MDLKTFLKTYGETSDVFLISRKNPGPGVDFSVETIYFTNGYFEENGCTPQEFCSRVLSYGLPKYANMTSEVY